MDDNHILYIMNRRVHRVDVRNNNATAYIDSDLLQSHLGFVSRIQLSHDFDYICKRISFANGSLNPERQVYNFEIVHRINKQVLRVGVTKGMGEVQQMFVWSPAGNDYAFVQNGQLYYVEKPESSNSTRISDGNTDKINGLHDWVYTEEIFDQNKQAIWWSPSGSQIAFITHNPNDVGKISMTLYRKGDPYPSNSEVPYPKTMARFLPVYTLSLWDRHLKQTKVLDVQLRNSVAPHYLISVNWVRLFGREVLAAVWANRYQNQVSITLCNYEAARCHLVHEYIYRAKQWAMPSDYQSMDSARDALFVIVPKAKSDGNVYNHVVRLTIPENWQTGGRAVESTLTIGPFDVSRIARYDETHDLVYFVAQAPTPSDQHVYVTKASPTEEPDTVVCKCVSCVFENCTYQRGLLFSPDGKRLIVPCRGPGIAHNLVALVVGNSQLAKVTNTMVSEVYAQRMSKVMEPVTIYEDVELPDGYVARARIWLPHDPQRGGRPFPVLLQVYGGPGYQSVNGEYKWPIHKWLSLNRSVAVIEIDGRGSGARGWKYRSPIYGALGSVEMKDQIDALKILISKHQFLDNSRKVVYGWSYGGFAAANIVVMAPTNYFRCAVSVAPVTNFLYYDATYTERYMGQADRSAYDAADLVRDVSKFKTTRLLLMHGLYDDNVHFQNSALFIEELQKQMVDFDLMIFPNQNHGILVTRDYVNLKFYNFLNQCLQ